MTDDELTLDEQRFMTMYGYVSASSGVGKRWIEEKSTPRRRWNLWHWLTPDPARLRSYRPLAVVVAASVAVGGVAIAVETRPPTNSHPAVAIADGNKKGVPNTPPSAPTAVGAPTLSKCPAQLPISLWLGGGLSVTNAGFVDLCNFSYVEDPRAQRVITQSPLQVTYIPGEKGWEPLAPSQVTPDGKTYSSMNGTTVVVVRNGVSTNVGALPATASISVKGFANNAFFYEVDGLNGVSCLTVDVSKPLALVACPTVLDVRQGDGTNILSTGMIVNNSAWVVTTTSVMDYNLATGIETNWGPAACDSGSTGADIIGITADGKPMVACQLGTILFYPSPGVEETIALNDPAGVFDANQGVVVNGQFVLVNLSDPSYFWTFDETHLVLREHHISNFPVGNGGSAGDTGFAAQLIP